MVLVKATFQNVVRRFSVTDEISYDDLRNKLAGIFPELEGTTPESLTLYYRDVDGDLVSISSNEELKTAVQLLGKDSTLKLLIGVSAPKEKEKESDEEDDEIVFDMFLLPFHRPVSHHSLFSSPSPFSSGLFDVPSWSDRRRSLKQQEERIRKQRQYEEKMRKAHQEHLQELRKKAEEERKKQAEKKKSSKDVQRTSSKEGSQPVLPTLPPGWTVTPFGSWDPVVSHGPYSTSRVWGPWGFTATYEGTEEEKKKDEKKEKAKEKQTTTKEKKEEPKTSHVEDPGLEEKTEA